MGQRVTQRILECDICNNIPENGAYLWRMGNEMWCEACCDKADEEEEQSEDDSYDYNFYETCDPC